MKILTKEKIWICGYGTWPEQVTIHKLFGISFIKWYLAIVAILSFVVLPILYKMIGPGG